MYVHFILFIYYSCVYTETKDRDLCKRKKIYLLKNRRIVESF